MRLGGPVFADWDTPEEWAQRVSEHGYGACYCPIDRLDDDEAVRAYREAAGEAGLVIAEVGAWSNPISRDETERAEALELCKQRLDLADRAGARCCVNIAGSRAEKWDGPHPDNVHGDTFDLIVETVREIIDEVRPTRTFYTLETMPWIFPDSAGSYLELVQAIDRERFAVHMDVVNLVNSPRRYFDTAGLIRECFEKLGPLVKSCHAKDIELTDNLTVHLQEVRPGLGGLDYEVLLREMDRLDPDTPLMLEHLAGAEEYDRAAGYVRSVAQRSGVAFI